MKQRWTIMIAVSISLALGIGIGLLAAGIWGKQKDGQAETADGKIAAMTEAQEVDGEGQGMDGRNMEDQDTKGQDREDTNIEGEDAEGKGMEGQEAAYPKEGDSAYDEKEGGEEEPIFVSVSNPSWDYYIETPMETETTPLTLTVLEEKKNQITDEEKWFRENELELPDLNDEGYSCSIYGDRAMLDISRNGEAEATLDFSDYRYADDFRPEDRMFAEQEIRSAAVYEGVLYVSTFHYTYAETSPHNGYITAIDLEDYSVLWKTEALTCNSLNFEIIGDVILCGYGFTAEDDYLYQLDRKTGKRIGRILLASKADYVIFKDDKLFVRTYHTDYVFRVGD